jgi:hypothetical protein
MSLLSNQQGRPASVRARPPSGSPKGLSLAGQTILVTGCNSGIGQETCRVFALRGALVLGTARTKEKAAAAFATLPGKAVGYSCELSDPSSVRECRGARILSDMRPQYFKNATRLAAIRAISIPLRAGI